MIFVAKKSVIEECERYLKSLYLSRTGYPGHYKYKYYEPEGIPHGGSGGDKNKMNTPVQHDGEYVLTSSGSKDFGEITPEIARAIKRESGKIRLEVGIQENGHGYGETHIERPDRLRQLKNNGFENARDYIEFVANDFDAIYQGKDNNIILAKIGKNANVAFLSLKQNEKDKDVYWTVESAFISRKDYLNDKIVLWKK